MVSSEKQPVVPSVIWTPIRVNGLCSVALVLPSRHVNYVRAVGPQGQYHSQSL